MQFSDSIDNLISVWNEYHTNVVGALEIALLLIKYTWKRESATCDLIALIRIPHLF